MPQPKPKPKDSGYVFEVSRELKVSFRRADMDRPEAKKALETLLCGVFQVHVTAIDIDYVLLQAPATWPYLSVRLLFTPKAGLEVTRAKREPGKNSGNNSVITSVKSRPLYEGEPIH
jgi:hypothetical protein